MKCINVCNLAKASALSDSDGIVITQDGIARLMTMPAFRDYVALSSGAAGQVGYTTVELPAAGWANNRQTISVELVNVSTLVIVTPAQEDAENDAAYVESGVYCISQGEGVLTFACNATPSVDLLVNIALITAGELGVALPDAEEASF